MKAIAPLLFSLAALGGCTVVPVSRPVVYGPPPVVVAPPPVVAVAPPPMVAVAPPVVVAPAPAPVVVVPRPYYGYRVYGWPRGHWH